MALPTQSEELLQLIVEHVPQGLLFILVLYIFTLFAKDILVGGATATASTSLRLKRPLRVALDPSVCVHSS